MFRKFTLIPVVAVAVGTLMMLSPTQARADHERFDRRERNERFERHELRRVVWQYQGGFFKDVGNGRWEEENASGRYFFQEVRRNPQFVDLFDASRGLTARLYGNAMYLQGGNYPVFTKFYDGRWTE